MWRLFLWLAVGLGVSLASEAFAATDPCQAAGACREIGDVRLPGDEGQSQSVHVGQTLPWVVDNNVLLFPGETVVISLPQKQEGQLPMSLVATGEAAKTRNLQAGELRFNFEVGDSGMLLIATSAHPRWLHYMAVMVTPDGAPSKTSVCPIIAGKMAFESWPHGIVQLALTNFIPVGEEELVCS